jgi:HD-GYP domain-containing protein (c-di-GMP phosphodiesterase class II)
MSLRTSTPRLGTDGEPKSIPHSRDAASSDERLQMVGRRSEIPRALIAYSLALGVLAATVGLVLVVSGATLGTPGVVIALCVAAVLTDRASVRLSATTDLTASPVVTLFAAVLFGPLAGGLVGAASELGDAELLQPSSNNRAPRLKWLTYTSTRFVSGAAMGLTAQAILARADSTVGLFLATITASAVGEALEIGFAALTGRVRRSRTNVIRTVGPMMATAVCVYAPVVASLAFAYETISPWSALLFLAPALAAQQLFSLYQDKARLYEEQLELSEGLRVANRRLSEANLSFATALVQTLEESDRYTAGHSRAVATYSRDIASALNLPPDEQERAYVAGLVHDIGKIGLPPAVLNKEGRLTLDERRQMERHSEIGERILSKVDAYADVALIVRHHHERIDGHGYPDGILGPAIPTIARIIAVADAYNAMTSDRPYRPAMVYPAARDRLLQAMGSQFHTDAVVAFVSLLADATEDYRYARGPSFGVVESSADPLGGVSEGVA